MLEVTSRTKRLLIVAFSVAISLVIILSAALMLNFSRNAQRFLQSGSLRINANGVDASGFSALFDQYESTAHLLKRYPLAGASTLIVAIPIGDIRVVETAGTEVVVHCDVTTKGSTASTAQANASRYYVSSSSYANALSLGIGDTDNADYHLERVQMIVDVPRDVSVTVRNRLGNIHVSGHFPSMSLHDNMGNIDYTGAITRSLTVTDLMGNIHLLLLPGSTTDVTDNLGNIEVYLEPGRTVSVTATATMGTISTGTSRTSATNGVVQTVLGSGTLQGTMRLQDNLGDVSVSPASVGGGQ